MYVVIRRFASCNYCFVKGKVIDRFLRWVSSIFWFSWEEGLWKILFWMMMKMLSQAWDSENSQRELREKPKIWKWNWPLLFELLPFVLHRNCNWRRYTQDCISEWFLWFSESSRKYDKTLSISTVVCHSHSTCFQVLVTVTNANYCMFQSKTKMHNIIVIYTLRLS